MWVMGRFFQGLALVTAATFALAGCASKAPEVTSEDRIEQVQKEASEKAVTHTVTLGTGYYSDQITAVMLELGFRRGVISPEAEPLIRDRFLEHPVTFTGTVDEVIAMILSGVPLKAEIKEYDDTVVFVPQY